MAAPDAEPAGGKHMRVAVAGNPNSGKTTLFNALTGLRHKVANYPGVTVEKREATARGLNVTLLDLPGAYGLSARSPDEEIARDILLGRLDGTPRPDGVLLVVDASNLERNLYLASQVLDFGMPVVIACNMMDVATERGIHIDCDALSEELGVPVIPTVGRKRQGIPDIRQALGQIDRHKPPRRPWRLHEAFETAIERTTRAMERAATTPAHAVRGGALLWLSDYLSGENACRVSAERYLAKIAPQHADELRAAAADLSQQDGDAAAEAIETRYAWISEVAGRVRTSGVGRDHRHDRDAVTITDRIDAVLTHRLLGLLIFISVVFVVFMSVFSWSDPVMALIEDGEAILGGWFESHMAEGPVRSLIVDGVIAGVGAVIIFFPQICMLFLWLAVLEDSGYMARAAFMVDRLMSRVGLAGRSFIPLLSSYACAVPGIMAARTIENRRDRFTTIMVAPLMSCSARLPVYLIIIAAVFGDNNWLKVGVMFGLYLFGTVMALLMALVFKKTLLVGPRPTFIMELPPYHIPRLSHVIRSMWDRSRIFLTSAGTIIIIACIVVWAMSYFPRIDESRMCSEGRAALAVLDPDDATGRANLFAAEQISHSYIGQLGRFIEPVIEPLGFDWRIGVGVLSSFLAREVFVGTMGITFAVGEADEESSALRDKLTSAKWPDGRQVLTPLVGVTLMVFYVLACQCVSTLAVVKRETNSWRWPALMFGYMTLLAYSGALLVHQVGIALGLG
ncbi:MAG: ferrous iron transport protein B [Planctomycetota bacterium]